VCQFASAVGRGLARYIIKTEIATGCAKSEAENDQERNEGHPGDGEGRQPLSADNMIMVYAEIHVDGCGCMAVILALLEAPRGAVCRVVNEQLGLEQR
jgi:hypothetical protein